MKAPSITPVPWIAQGSTVFAGGKVVASRVNNPANARAIAALPELVAALKPFLDVMPEILCYVDADTGNVYSDLCDSARAALSAAGLT